MLIVNQKIFWEIMAPAFVIMTGVWLKNGGKQYGQGWTENTKYSGILFFVSGWIGLIYVLAKNTDDNTAKWVKIVSGLIIMLSALGAGMIMEKYPGSSYLYVFALLFAVGWVGLGWAGSKGMPKSIKGYSWGSSGLILLAMLVTLPWQRKVGVVDGPGMSLFALGFVSLALANSSSQTI